VNKVEAIKKEREGLDIIHDIRKFAKEGWESISEEDLQRLKWYGLFLRNPTPGFFMLRVRIPQGQAHSRQIAALAQISRSFGNGVIDITTRQQIQLRHLRIDHVPYVFELMDEVGLTSMQTGMDNVRNIMGCPVAGLHPREFVDPSPVIGELNRLIVGNREFTNLPRKFNIAITGCPDNCIHSETQDLALVPATRREGEEDVTGFNILAGGKLGSGGYRIASPLDVFVRPGEAVEVCAEIVRMFRDHGNRETRTQNRLAFLLDEWGEERFRSELETRLARPLARGGEDLRGLEKSEHIGIYRQSQPTMNYVGLKVVVGRIEAEKLEGLAGLAERYGNGEMRLSPAQCLILPNISDPKLGDLLEEPLLKEFVYHPSSIMKGLVSCVGIDYCHLATIETKRRAREVADQLEQSLGSTAPLTMHWSGCPAGCGNHLVADIGLIGKRARVGGQVVDAVDVFMGGRAGKFPRQALKVLENVPCDLLPRVLEGIIPYHAREKMHLIKGLKRKSSGDQKEVSGSSGQKSARVVPEEDQPRAETGSENLSAGRNTYVSR